MCWSAVDQVEDTNNDYLWYCTQGQGWILARRCSYTQNVHVSTVGNIVGVQYSKNIGYSYKRNINAMISEINIGHMRMDTNTPNICALFNDAEDWGFLGRK